MKMTIAAFAVLAVLSYQPAPLVIDCPDNIICCY